MVTYESENIVLLMNQALQPQPLPFPGHVTGSTASLTERQQYMLVGDDVENRESSGQSSPCKNTRVIPGLPHQYQLL